MPPNTKPFTGAEHRTTQGDRTHVDTPALFIAVDQRFAALQVRQDFNPHLIGHAPTRAEHPVAPLVAAVVEALPIHRQDSRQHEIQLFFATQHLGPGGSMHRVRRAHSSVGHRAHRAADGHRRRATDQHARQFAEEFPLSALEHQQRCDRQPHARGFAAADLAHHHRTAADGDVGGDQPGRHDLGIAGAAIAAAHGGLAVDSDFVRALGQKLRRHRRMLHADEQVQRFGHRARRRGGNGGAPHLGEEAFGHVEVAGFCFRLGHFQLGTGRRDMGRDRSGGPGGGNAVGEGVGGAGENVRLHRGRKQRIAETLA
ncbi:hypothetical protein PS676_05711 [Pseudomonas fluorescens]|nr:hypothetical protein PS676_05711 [Pseudomonas fluorescens]